MTASEFDDARADALRCADEAAHLERDNLRLSGEIDRLTRDLAEVRAAAASRDADMRRLAEERDNTRVEAARWWHATAQLMRDNENLRATWSWRVTAPLRAGKHAAKELLRMSRATAQRAFGALTRFVAARPGLKGWLADRLRAFPALREKARGAFLRHAATPANLPLAPVAAVPAPSDAGASPVTAEAGAPSAADAALRDLPEAACAVHRALSAALERQRVSGALRP